MVFAAAHFPAPRLRVPKPWWPNGYGAPALPALVVTASVGGAVSDERTVRVALRPFGHASENPVVFEPGANRVARTVGLDRQHARWVRVLAGRRATPTTASPCGGCPSPTAGPETDLAPRAAASASSTDNAAGSAAAAVDGDPNTRWSSGSRDEQCIRTDPGEARDGRHRGDLEVTARGYGTAPAPQRGRGRRTAAPPAGHRPPGHVRGGR
ncbi:hypothetical protein [Streptomyces cinereospinus]|uniref:Uncharacterized protein n=1 Tax=Streptomyces cinereospinus TaxID=285561 RepID=A0ABV5NA12_9ACTN